MISLNNSAFIEMQEDRTEQEMADYLGISRTQLWRIKRGDCSAGNDFIAKVLEKFPKSKFQDIFFTSNVPSKEQKTKEKAAN